MIGRKPSQAHLRQTGSHTERFIKISDGSLNILCDRLRKRNAVDHLGWVFPTGSEVFNPF
jgi:hypothetical protein